MIWLAVFAGFLFLEAMTMALTTIWFAGGALVAFLLSLLHFDYGAQVGGFLLVSALLLFLTRPLAIKYVNARTEKTNMEGLIGKKARVTSEINNDLSIGTAVIGGQEWTARSEDGTVIPEGTMVIIKKISGVKLIVNIIKEDKVC